MAVILPSDWRNNAVLNQIIIDRCCVICDETVSENEPAVLWHGRGWTRLYHPCCATQHGMALIGDAREATLAQGRNQYATRAARVAGTALRVREGLR
jgi:hypothetical protein